MAETKRRISMPEDSGTIENVQYNAAAGAQKNLNVLPVPEAVPTGGSYGLPSGDQKIGKGKLVWLVAAGYTLKDSSGKYADLTIAAGLAPIGSVVSTGLQFDTIVAPGAYLLADDSSSVDQNYPSGS